MSRALGRIEQGQNELKENIHEIKNELFDKGGKGVCRRLSEIEHRHQVCSDKQIKNELKKNKTMSWGMGIFTSILTGVCVGVIILLFRNGWGLL
jgi:hypothetical protein